MANRCPDCNKFVSLEMEDPDVQECDIEPSEDGKAGIMRLTVQLTKSCAECGCVMTGKTLEVEIDVDLTGFEAP